jgi:hypothetical protein
MLCICIGEIFRRGPVGSGGPVDRLDPHLWGGARTGPGTAGWAPIKAAADPGVTSCGPPHAFPGTIYLKLGSTWKDTYSRAAMLFFVVAFLVRACVHRIKTSEDVGEGRQPTQRRRAPTMHACV